MGSQTDTHILDHNIVKTYEWNEWELRRKALKMVRFQIFYPTGYLFESLYGINIFLD